VIDIGGNLAKFKYGIIRRDSISRGLNNWRHRTSIHIGTMVHLCLATKSVKVSFEKGCMHLDTEQHRCIRNTSMVLLQVLYMK